MTPPILIAGIGNILLQDDGLGPQAIAQLEAQYEFGDKVELLDLGTTTLDFVDYLRGRGILVLIDALAGGGEPGELLTFDKEQLQESFLNVRLSPHQPCLNQTLHMAEAADIDLQEVLLVGVVGNSFDVGTELGPYVSRAMPEVLELVVNFVRRRGVKVEKRAMALAMPLWWESEDPAAS